MDQSQQHFRPDHYKWVIVKNRRYNLLRKKPRKDTEDLDTTGYEKIQDIKEVEDDAKNVRKGIIGLGARSEDITEFEDASYKNFSDQIKKLRNTIYNNWTNGRQKTFVFFYYAGHGIMTNTTFAVCNGGKRRTKIQYPLEKELRSIGTEEGGYVLGIFDCCRQQMTEEMRSRGVNPPQDNQPMDDYVNLIFVFGCPPNSGVSAKSTIAVEFFEKLSSVAKPYDGSVFLPSAFQFWHPGGDGEVFHKCSDTLELKHIKWKPKGPPPA